MNWTENSLLLEHPIIARIPNAFPLPLKWPQFQDALLWALGQKALCILIPFIFNQDQNILPNLSQAAFGYKTSILLYFNWFGSSPHCRLYKLIVNIANIPSENCCTTHLKCSLFFLYFQLLFSRCRIMHFPTIAFSLATQNIVCVQHISLGFPLQRAQLISACSERVSSHDCWGERTWEQGRGIFFCGIMSLTMKVTLRPPWTLPCDQS